MEQRQLTLLSEATQNQPLSEALVEQLMTDDILPEYDIDYCKARPNRFAARLAQTRTAELKADVAAVFPTQKAVNEALRTLVEAQKGRDSGGALLPRSGLRVGKDVGAGPHACPIYPRVGPILASSFCNWAFQGW